VLAPKFRLFRQQEAELKYQAAFIQVFFISLSEAFPQVCWTQLWSVWPKYFQDFNCVYKKNGDFGQNVFITMGFLQNAGVMHCKPEMPNSKDLCPIDWIKPLDYKVIWDQDLGNSLWHNHHQIQQGQEERWLCWTRKSSFRVAMRFPDVTKTLKEKVRHSKQSCLSPSVENLA